MKKQKLFNLFIFILALLFVLLSSGCPKQTAADQGAEIYSLAEPYLQEVQEKLTLAYDWLIKNQSAEGSWKSNPAITSLVLYAMVEKPGLVAAPEVKAAIAKGYKYLEGFVQADGGIYQNEYQHYSTSVALLAFTAMENNEYANIIKNARAYLIKDQCDESEGYAPDHAYYGGIGYGGDDRPDLSNTHLALEAVKNAEIFAARFNLKLPDDAKKMETEKNEQGLHWEKALVFLARCQNLSAVNQMSYRTDDDGGFMYETGHYKDDRSHSYGSMTYAGVKSLLYANVDKTDIRVQKAFEWIEKHYTLDENPGFNTTSIYYYYMTFAKCLYIMGIDTIKDTAGVEHNWREELVTKLVSLQDKEGFWVNTDGRYWENVKDLTTAYTMVALKFAAKGFPAGTSKLPNPD